MFQHLADGINALAWDFLGKNIFVFKTAGCFHFGDEIDQAELYYRDLYGSGLKTVFPW